MSCFRTLSSEGVWTCGQEYEIKASYHNKLPLVGFAEKKIPPFIAGLCITHSFLDIFTTTSTTTDQPMEKHIQRPEMVHKLRPQRKPLIHMF